MSTRTQRERKQHENEHYKKILARLLGHDCNKNCADCLSKGPRWVSWNLGVFLCIRCSGIHRSLGVHISKVKSVNLDTWTSDQVVGICSRGNEWAKEKYEATLPRDFKRPQTDSSLEYFIREKYEKRKYSNDKDVALRSVEEFNIFMKSESPNLKRERKKVVNNGVIPSPSRVNKPTEAPTSQPRLTSSTIPNQQPTRTTVPNTNREPQPTTDDLLGLSSPVEPVVTSAPVSQDLPPSADLTFDLFTSMSSSNNAGDGNVQVPATTFEQQAIEQPVEKKQMSKDSILSLYSQGNAMNIQANPYMSTGAFSVPGQSAMSYSQQQFPMSASNIGFQSNTGYNMQPGMMGYPKQNHMQAMQPPHQWQQQQMQQQMQNMHLGSNVSSGFRSVAGLRSCSSMPQMSAQSNSYQYPINAGGMLSLPQQNGLASSQPSLFDLDASNNFSGGPMNAGGQTLSSQLWK